MTQIKCKKCGEPMFQGATFCYNCEDKKSNILLIIVVIAIILAVTAFVFYLKKSLNDKSEFCRGDLRCFSNKFALIAETSCRESLLRSEHKLLKNLNVSLITKFNTAKWKDQTKGIINIYWGLTLHYKQRVRIRMRI